MAKKKNEKSESSNNSIWIFAIIAVVFAAFSPALKNALVSWDDYAYIMLNPIIRDLSLKNIAHIFDPSTFVVGNYHPLTVLVYTVEYALFELDPTGYHVVSLLLHLVNIWLFSRIALRLVHSKWPVILMTALFAVHPMRVESVVWAAELKDVLYVAFFLGGVLWYLRTIAEGKTSVVNYVVVGLLYLLSLFSKGQAVVFPVVLVLLDYLRARPFTAKTILEKAPYFGMSLAFGLHAVTAQTTSFTQTRLQAFPLNERIFFALYGTGSYVVDLFLPTNLACFYDYPPAGEMLHIYLGAAAVVAATAAALYFWRSNRMIVGGLLIYLCTIAPVSQILPVGNAITSDRYTYLPYIGLFIVLAALVQMLPHRYQKMLPGGIAAITVALAGMSYAQSKTWKDSETLWLQALKVNPNCAVAHSNLSAEYIDTGRPEQAISHAQSAIAKPGRYLELYRSHNNLGTAYSRLNRNEEAIPCYTKALEIKPDFYEARLNRAIVSIAVNRFEDAERDATMYLEGAPPTATAYFVRGMARKALRKFDESVMDLKQAVAIQPTYTAALVNLANIYINANRPQEAIGYYNQALAQNPNDGNALLNRSKAHYLLGDKDAARRDYQAAAQRGAAEPAYEQALR